MLKPEIRTLSLSEVERLVDWAATEGWNPGLHDARAFLAADPEGFIGAFVDGDMVAGISAVAYGDAFGFIGLYICRPDVRGRGYGRAVWDTGMARLSGRTIGLDGVPAQQANYRRMGFSTAYETIRYSGRLDGGQAGQGCRIVSVTDDLIGQVLDIDSACFPAPRTAFLRRWLQPPHRALACVVDGEVRGFGVARACRSGFKVGPLFASDDDMAFALLDAVSAGGEGDIHLDVPEGRVSFIGGLVARGLLPGFETARMYRGALHAPAPTGVFGVTTLELG